MPTLPTMFIAAGPSGVREEPLAPRAGCGAVEVMEATAMGSTPGLGPKDELVPRTGLPRSWFSVSGWGWFTWKGLTGAEAAAAPGREEGQWLESEHPSPSPRAGDGGGREHMRSPICPSGAGVLPHACCSAEPGRWPTHGTYARRLHLRHGDEDTEAARSSGTRPESQRLNEAMPGVCLPGAGPPGLPLQLTAGTAPLLCLPSSVTTGVRERGTA